MVHLSDLVTPVPGWWWCCTWIQGSHLQRLTIRPLASGAPASLAEDVAHEVDERLGDGHGRSPKEGSRRRRGSPKGGVPPPPRRRRGRPPILVGGLVSSYCTPPAPTPCRPPRSRRGHRVRPVGVTQVCGAAGAAAAHAGRAGGGPKVGVRRVCGAGGKRRRHSHTYGPVPPPGIGSMKLPGSRPLPARPPVGS